ncbi:MAG: hypothetical protein C5S41_00825 [Candidatus Methanomarinus sp.]|jgi:hypothetical protein|nr:MAG: hypothetical protein C5S41_00825 [ANME-2 cluster archaeon]KAF5429403.1 hypothetical protein C5S42_01775 [ANME-2 cluster archaeon]
MSLRIVSGVLLPKSDHRDNGSATIRLIDQVVVAGDATIDDKCEYGGSTKYDSEPCKAVSIRAFDGQPDSINLSDKFQGGNGFDEVVIYWNCNGGEITEITYFFAGEE